MPKNKKIIFFQFQFLFGAGAYIPKLFEARLAPPRMLKYSLFCLVSVVVLLATAEQCVPDQGENLAVSPLLWCKHEAKLVLKAPCDVQVEEYFEVPWVAPKMTRTLVVPSADGVADITASQILSPTSRVPLAILNVTRLEEDLLVNVTIEAAEATNRRSAFKLRYLMKGALRRWMKCTHDNSSFRGADNGNSISWRPGTIAPISSSVLSVEFQLPDEFITGGTRSSNIFGAYRATANKSRADARTILKLQLHKPDVTTETDFMAVFYLRKDSESFGTCRKARDCEKEQLANDLKGYTVQKRARILPITAWIGIGAGAILFAFLFGLCILCFCQSKKKDDEPIPPANEADNEDARTTASNQVISLPMFMRDNT